jgi:hypothetical protein
MKQTKMTFAELEKSLPSWKEAVIVFTENSFDGYFTEEERSYKIYSDAKYFDANMGGSSLFGDCLDGNDSDVRLDSYMNYHGWEIDYCYIVK